MGRWLELNRLQSCRHVLNLWQIPDAVAQLEKMCIHMGCKARIGRDECMRDEGRAQYLIRIAEDNTGQYVERFLIEISDGRELPGLAGPVKTQPFDLIPHICIVPCVIAVLRVALLCPAKRLAEHVLCEVASGIVGRTQDPSIIQRLRDAGVETQKVGAGDLTEVGYGHGASLEQEGGGGYAVMKNTARAVRGAQPDLPHRGEGWDRDRRAWSSEAFTVHA